MRRLCRSTACPAGSVKVGIAPGEREFFRVVNGTGSRNLDLSIANQQLVLVAQDGVPLVDYPGGPRDRNGCSHIVIPPAGRAEFIVTGPAAPDGDANRRVRYRPEGRQESRGRLSSAW